MNFTKDKFFLDTNILVYAYEKQSGDKHEISKKILLAGLESENLYISTQVIGEFINIIKRKLEGKFNIKIINTVIDLFAPESVVSVDFSCTKRALNFLERYKISFWDSQILASAEKCGARAVISEDLNNLQQYFSLNVINPFIL